MKFPSHKDLYTTDAIALSDKHALDCAEDVRSATVSAPFSTNKSCLIQTVQTNQSVIGRDKWPFGATSNEGD